MPPISTQNIDEHEARNQKHSLTIRGHRTSISIENWYWDQLKSMAEHKGISRTRLIADIDHGRSRDASLSSALRIAVGKHLANT